MGMENLEEKRIQYKAFRLQFIYEKSSSKSVEGFKAKIAH